MSNLDRRGGYTPRKTREQRAYRLAVTGAGAGALGVIGIVLSIVGVVGAGIPILLLIVAAVCAFAFMRVTGQR